jgi:hypothetical protein
MENGLALDGFGTALYFGGLLLWSAFVAYLVVFGRQGVSAGHGNTGHGHAAQAHAPAAHAPAHHAAPAHGHAPAAEEPAKPFRGYSQYEGFKSFATGDTLTIEDIVKGLARESGATALHEAEVAEDVSEEHDEHPHEHDPAQAATAAQANEFLRLLVEGERDAAFETLREIEEHGEGAEPFLRRVLTAVEAALNSRLNNGTCDLRTL